MIRGQDDFIYRGKEYVTCYGGCRPRESEGGILTHGNIVSMYGGVILDPQIDTPIFPSTKKDKAESKYTGELNISKDSSIKKENSHLKINMNSSFWSGSSVSSTEHLSRIEKEYLANERAMLIQDMNELKGKVDTKNLAKVSSTLSDAAQAGLTRKDARTFDTLSNELQKVVDNAKTFNNYSFKEGDKKDLEDKLSANNTLSWLKSENGQAVCQELGINADNLDNIEPDKDGNIVIDGRTIQLSKDKLSITEKSDKNNTYETSTYTLDDKYKPTENETVTATESIELETYEKYHTDSKITNLFEKDPKTGENLHLPKNVQVSDSSMEERINKSEEIFKRLQEVSYKSIGDLEFSGNHAYYVDENGVEHQFYYDDKNGNFINTNVTPNKEKGGFDVEVNLPKTTNFESPLNNDINAEAIRDIERETDREKKSTIEALENEIKDLKENGPIAPYIDQKIDTLELELALVRGGMDLSEAHIIAIAQEGQQLH